MFGIGSLACYQPLAQVGEGTYGYVYKSLDKRTGELVALKRLILNKEYNGFPLCAVREIKFLKSLSHKNIVQLKDIVTSKGCEHLDTVVKSEFKSGADGNRGEHEAKDEATTNRVVQHCGNLYLVFEYIEHDLGGLVDAKYKFSLKALKVIMRQIFEALDFLAARKLVHRDIKSSNILISNRHQIKLADFGLARSFESADGTEEKMNLTNNVVTMWYKPPELLLGAVRYTNAVDMWSAGCVLAELDLGRPLMPGKSELEQFDLVCRTFGTPSPDSWPECIDLPLYATMITGETPRYTSSFRATYGSKFNDSTLGLLERVFSMDPTRRTSARIALNHAFFLTKPLAPLDPTELEPLNIEEGTSMHEYETKLKRKRKEEETRRVRAEAAAASSSSSANDIAAVADSQTREPSCVGSSQYAAAAASIANV